MRKLTFTLIVTIVIATGCTKTDNLTYLERRAIGEYIFEKVVVRNDFQKSENITQDYHNMVLQLDDKKQAALIDRNTSTTYLGKFDIVTQYIGNDDDGNNTSENTIIIDIKSPNRGTNFHWVGEDANITTGRLRFKARKADGRHVFKLKKI